LSAIPEIPKEGRFDLNAVLRNLTPGYLGLLFLIDIVKPSCRWLESFLAIGLFYSVFLSVLIRVWATSDYGGIVKAFLVGNYQSNLLEGIIEEVAKKAGGSLDPEVMDKIRTHNAYKRFQDQRKILHEDAHVETSFYWYLLCSTTGVVLVFTFRLFLMSFQLCALWLGCDSYVVFASGLHVGMLTTIVAIVVWLLMRKITSIARDNVFKFDQNIISELTKTRAEELYEKIRSCRKDKEAHTTVASSPPTHPA